MERVLTRDGNGVGEKVLTILEDQSGAILALTPSKLLRIRDRAAFEAIDLPKRLYHQVTSGQIRWAESGLSPTEKE